jgi:hypothetical protein
MKESPMKTSITARVAALVAAAFVTFGSVDLIADYAYPEATPVRVATAPRLSPPSLSGRAPNSPDPEGKPFHSFEECCHGHPSSAELRIRNRVYRRARRDRCGVVAAVARLCPDPTRKPCAAVDCDRKSNRAFTAERSRGAFVWWGGGHRKRSDVLRQPTPLGGAIAPR